MKTSGLVWLPVPGFPHYLINSEGTIKSIQPGKQERIISSRIDRAGYLTVRLSYMDHVNTLFVHRLVAEVFLPNPHRHKFVNHLDGNKLNNCARNLEWISHSNNILHAHRTGLIANKRLRRIVVDSRTGQRFSNVSQAARHLGIPVSTCRQYLVGSLPNPTYLALDVG